MCHNWDRIITDVSANQLVKVTSAFVRFCVTERGGQPREDDHLPPKVQLNWSLVIEPTSEQGASCTIGPINEGSVWAGIVEKFLTNVAPGLSQVKLFVPIIKVNDECDENNHHFNEFTRRLADVATRLSVVQVKVFSDLHGLWASSQLKTAFQSQ